MKMGKVVWVLAALVLATPVLAQGQTTGEDPVQGREPETLVSDRPGLGDGAHVLGSGVWQGEFGGTIEAAPSDEYLVGSSLVRMGLANLEVRLLVPSVVIREGGKFLQLSDLGVGVKAPLDLGRGFQWSVLGTMTIPTGSDNISAQDPGLGGVLIAERGLTETLAVALNVGYGFTFDGILDGTASFLVTPVFALPGQDGTSIYAGYAGYLAPGENTWWMEGGLTRVMTTDSQWDLNAGYNPGTHSWFLGAGITLRRP